MKEAFQEKILKESIDHRLSGLTGNPFLAQRIMAAEKGEEKIVKKKISVSLILALVMLVLTLSAGVALMHSIISDQLFGNQDNIPKGVIDQIHTPKETNKTQLGQLSLDEWLYDGHALHTSFTIANPSQETLLYTLDGILLNGQPITYNRSVTEGAGDSGFLLGGMIDGVSLPTSYSVYNEGETIASFDEAGKYQGFISVPQGEGTLKISVAIWRPINQPQLADYKYFEGYDVIDTLDHLITDTSGYANLWLFRPESHQRATRYGESSAQSYADAYKDLGWAELVDIIEAETQVTLNKNAVPHAVPASTEYRQNSLHLVIDSFELTQAGGQMECRLLGNYDTVKRYMAEGVQLVDKANGRILSTGCIDNVLDGSEEGRSILLPIAAFTGEMPREVYLAPVIGYDNRWDKATPDYDPGFEKPDNVVAPFQFDFEKGFLIPLDIF